MIRRTGAQGAIVLLAAACGGGDAAPAGAVQAGGAAAVAQQAAESTQAEAEVGLVREVFTYGGGNRDPFRSLITGGAGLRPFIDDLRVTSIIYDARYPARSVAVLRDNDTDERYQVRVGDPLGRLRVAEIREDAVVVSTQEFGQVRLVELFVTRRREGNP